MEKYNPIKLWRGKRSPQEAAWCLAITTVTYLILEAHPERLSLTTDTIFEIQEVTNISLPALVDWLTETNAKEAVS